MRPAVSRFSIEPLRPLSTILTFHSSDADISIKPNENKISHAAGGCFRGESLQGLVGYIDWLDFMLAMPPAAWAERRYHVRFVLALLGESRRLDRLARRKGLS